MYVIANPSNLYIYSTHDHMLEALALERRESHLQKMQYAAFVLFLMEDGKTCQVLKDRSGTFSQNVTHSTKKMLSMIDVLTQPE